MGQYRRLGASLDYRRERFTMDDAYVRAVMRFFVHLYKRGWIYRDNRIVNWCPRCATAISDLEVVHRDVDDVLAYVRYPLADGSGHVTVATVRPPTMLADVAVAVQPGRRTLRLARRTGGDRAAGRAAGADHRRRAGRDGLRHRRAQDHAGPRPRRLRDRPPARPRRADGDRPRRPHERGGRPVRRDVAGGGRPRDSRGARTLRAARARGAVPARGRPLRALRYAGSSRSSRCSGSARCGSSPRPPSRSSRTAVFASTHRSRARSTWTGWRTSGRGASRASSGGATACRCGTAPAARRSWPRPRPTTARTAATPTSGARRTSSTRGSRRRCGRSPRSAGRRRPRSSAPSTRARSTRPRGRSSSSGSRG